MLVVGSFWGRAGGLIALGVVAAIATAGATVGSTLPRRRPLTTRRPAPPRCRTPTTSVAVEFTLDLSDVSDVEALDGRDIAIDGVGGRIEVIVPDGMDVDVQTAGRRRRQPGLRPAQRRLRRQPSTASVDGGADVPDMSITIDLVVGEIIVREAA